MHIYPRLRKPALFFTTLLVTVLLSFLLAACGTNSGSTGSPAPASPTATTVPGYGTSNGCPSDAVVSTQPGANVVVKFADANSTITAHNGDVVEVDLSFGHVWGGPTTSQGVLELQSPAGYASKVTNMCIWRFTAKATGTTNLSFTGRALCKKGQLCPQYIIAIPFTVVVK